ncbi:DUF2505 domain-containing protein [Trueperella sp. LYQ143]|uniref:DUF2505 domain-containing protein n=1 Tax=unclassified Trueperella TaxID=2630174 RepID=UPI003983A0DA
MKFESETSYIGPLDDVIEVLVSRELLLRRAERLGHQGEITYSRSSQTHTWSITVDNAQLPSIAKSVISHPLTVEVCGTTRPIGDGAAIDYHVQVHGAPVRAHIDLIAANAGATTPAKITGEISVNIPLFGKRIEKTAISHIAKFIAEDTDLVNTELAQRRAASN